MSRKNATTIVRAVILPRAEPTDVVLNPSPPVLLSRCWDRLTSGQAALHKPGSDIWAPIWSPNDQLVIFKWTSNRPRRSRLYPIDAGRAVSDPAGHRPPQPRRDDRI